MEWLNGLLINQFVSAHLSDNNVLTELQKKLVAISNDIEKHKIGHGDLQCGNIILTGTSSNFQVKLIDYDVM
jgi:thiamine kinase-like enzyme